MIRPERFLFAVVAVFFSCQGLGRVLPAEKSELNYTTVYFEENFVGKASEYELELFSDSLLSTPVAKKTAAIPAFWVEDLDWATHYYWKVTAYSTGHQQLSSTGIHHFSILKIPYLNYSGVRVDVKKNEEGKHAGGLISIDYTKSIIDRKGRQVWAIPPLPGIPLGKMFIRDLRITHDNTVTFLTLQQPFEIGLDGNVLWQAPYPFLMNSDTIYYHHDFKKTPRGTYMVLGERMAYRCLMRQPNNVELQNSSDVRQIHGELYKRTLMTYLLEFDKSGKLIWYWDANDYVTDVDLNAKKVEKGTPNFATHANAFGENKEGTKVYVSFRDLSRIVRIDKASKKVEQSYGEKYPSGEAGIFLNIKNQHDANPTDRNTFYTFNNNGFLDTKTVSSILEVSEGLGKKENPIVWKFNLDFDTLTTGKSVNGGNIVELPNRNLLFCAGAMNRVFEISKNKEIVWDALLYSHGLNTTESWIPFSQYRSNWIRQLNWYYVMAKWNSPLKAEGKKITMDLTFYNTGNVEDSYEIEVVNKKQELIHHQKMPLVKSGEQFQTVLKFRTGESPESLKILVRSAGSSQQTEVLKLTDVN